MTDSDQELADAIEQLTQHIQVLYETIEDLKTEVQWANNNRFAPAPNAVSYTHLTLPTKRIV